MPDLALRGIIAATVLPQTDGFEIDVPALRSYMAWLLAEGVHGLAINVDTGEGPHLPPRERLTVVETVADVVQGRVPIISGLGATYTSNAVATARDLKQAGADALLVFPISAFRGQPLPIEVPLHYYRSVGEGADIPLVLFQLQESLGGVELPIDAILELARLPHVIAIKEATFDALKYKRTVAALRHAEADIAILTGNDNFIYESFLLDADGALIGFGTLATRMQVDMFEAHERGDHPRAKELGARIQRLADCIFQPPVRNYRARLKEALCMLDVIPNPVIRPPLLPIPDAERTQIRAELAHIGLLAG